MRLLSLSLRNICQHRSLSWQFGNGVIGIFGANGSGKSNAINIGCYGGLTNDYSRGVGGREHQICQLASAEEPSRITLRAEQFGTEFEIMRQLQPSVKHRLRYNDVELTAANPIQAALEDLLKIKRQLLDNYVFVAQWELLNFFKQTPAERARSFAYVCDTSRAEKIYELLGNQLTVDSPLAVQVPDNRDEIRQQIGDYQRRQAEAQDKLDEATERLLAGEQLAEYQQTVKRHERHAALLEDLSKRQDDVAAKLKAARDTVSRYKTAQTKLESLEPLLEAVTAKARDAQQQMKTYDLEKQRWQDYQRCQRELDVLEDKVWPMILMRVPTPLEELRQTRQELLLAMQPYRDLIKRFENIVDGKTAECPTCGQPLTDVGDRVQQAKQKLQPLEETLATLEESIGERSTYEKALASRAKEIEHDDKQKEVIGARRDGFGSVVEPRRIDTDECLRLVNDAKDLTGRLNSARSAVRMVELKKAEHITSHKAAKAELAAMEQKIQELEVSDEEYSEADQALTRHKAAELDVRGYQTSVNEFGEFVNDWEKELVRVTNLLKRNKGARKWIQLLEDVRGVVHRDNLPYQVHHNALLRMEDQINETLEQFDSPFSVTTEEGLSYVAHFPNGIVMPAAGLSGGQQVVLSLALRWSLNSLFASQIGMMVLDEPTAGLDERNMDCLEAALAGLSAAARAKGYQLIIVTHEQRLESVFDQVLRLTA